MISSCTIMCRITLVFKHSLRSKCQHGNYSQYKSAANMSKVSCYLIESDQNRVELLHWQSCSMFGASGASSGPCCLTVCFTLKLNKPKMTPNVRHFVANNHKSLRSFQAADMKWDFVGSSGALASPWWCWNWEQFASLAALPHIFLFSFLVFEKMLLIFLTQK